MKSEEDSKTNLDDLLQKYIDFLEREAYLTFGMTTLPYSNSMVFDSRTVEQ